jgi:hypothetical protein
MKSKKVIAACLGVAAFVFCALLLVSCDGSGGSNSTDARVPGDPTALALSSSRIDVSWTAPADNAGVSGYKIYRDGAYVASVAPTSFSDSNLVPGKQYCYSISAINGDVESGQSGHACATTHSAWAKAYAGAGGSLFSIRPTSDGGYVGAGELFTGGLFQDLAVVRLDPEGNVLWQKAFGGPYEDLATSVEETSDGGFIVAGRTQRDGVSDSHLWLLKFDGEGNVLWQRAYHPSTWSSAGSVRQTPDGGFIAAGYTEGVVGRTDLWMMKLDASGDIVWQKRYDGLDSLLATSVDLTMDGGYIVAGVALLPCLTSSCDFFQVNYDFLLVKLDGGGNVVWQKKYGDETREELYEARQTADSGFIAVGNKPIGNGWGVQVVKLDGNGDILWQKAYAGPEGNVAYSVDETPDGGFIIAGDINGTGGDAWLLRIDANGGILWQKSYGGSLRDIAWSVRATPDEGCVLAGSTNLTSRESSTILVLKVDRNGDIGASCAAAGTSGVVAVDTNIISANYNAVAADTAAVVIETAVVPQDATSTVSETCP